MIHIHAKDQYAFLRSIGFDWIDDIKYVTHRQNDHRIEWHGLNGHDDVHQYKIRQNFMDSIIWYKDNKFHHNDDLPAVICPNDHREWWVDGKRHRENDLPTIIYADGHQEWWVNDKRHRENDLPAIIWPSGTREWYVDDKRHRENDLPAIITINGRQEWWVNNELIRVEYK